MSGFGAIRTAFLIIFLALTACGGSEARETRYMERGVEHFEEGNLQKAELEFKNVLQINPKNIDAVYFLGRIAEERGEHRRAFGIYQKVLEEQHTHAAANARIARFYLMAKRDEKAIESANKALAGEPENTDALAVKGAALSRMGRFDEARDILKKAVLIDPRNEEAQAAYVGLYRSQNDLAAAYRALESAIEHSPDSIALRLLKVGLLSDDNARDAIVDTYEEIISLADKPAAYHYQLAQIYKAWQMPDEAIAQMRAALESDPDNFTVANALIDYLSETKGFAVAESELKSRTQAEKGNPKAFFELAAFYIRQGLFEEAERTLAQLVETDGLTEGDASQAYAMLAELSLQQKEPEQAGAYVAKALEISPNDPRALTTRARLKLNDGDYRGATQDLRRVLRDMPQAPEPKRLIAYAHKKQGELELATDYLVTLIDENPSDHKARIELAEIIFMQNVNDIALEQLNKVLEAEPGNLRAIALKSEILTKTGDYEQAKYLAAQLRLNDTTKPLAERLLGNINFAEGNFEEALRQLEKAVELSPDDFSILRDLVRTLLVMDRGEEAVGRLQDYARAQPDDARPHNVLGEVFTQMADTENAATAFQQAIATNANWIVPRLNLARLRMKAGAVDQAESVLRDGLKKLPDNSTLLYTLGQLYERQQRYADAVAAYEQAHAADPRHFPSANNAASLYSDHFYRDEEKMQRAGELADRLANRNEPEILDTIGWVNYRQGNFDRAIAYLERAYEAAPEMEVIGLHLGLAHYRAGNFEQARPLLERALSGSPKIADRENVPTILEKLAVDPATN